MEMIQNINIRINAISIKQGQHKAWRIPSPKNLTLTFDLENQ
jgi:hypothetical protein